MARTYLVRGMFAGLLAALCAIAFAKVVAEPQIARAERFEHQLDVQRHRAGDTALVPRDIQDTLGLGTGFAVVGVALGGLYGLAFAAVYRRLTGAGAQATAAFLAAGAFAAIFLVPFLKYPANPPSVGNPDTIGQRTALHFLLIAVGLIAVGLAVIVQRGNAARFGTWNATLLAIGTGVAVVAFSYIVMPGANEVPIGFPPTVLWKFRLASLGTQLVLWACIGVLFGALTNRRESSPMSIQTSI